MREIFILPQDPEPIFIENYTVHLGMFEFQFQSEGIPLPLGTRRIIGDNECRTVFVRNLSYKVAEEYSPVFRSFFAFSKFAANSQTELINCIRIYKAVVKIFLVNIVVFRLNVKVARRGTTNRQNVGHNYRLYMVITSVTS